MPSDLEAKSVIRVWKSVMPSTSGHQTELKSGILRGVLEDNLKIAGQPAAVRPANAPAGKQHRMWVVVFLMLVIVSLIPDLGASLSPDGDYLDISHALALAEKKFPDISDPYDKYPISVPDITKVYDIELNPSLHMGTPVQEKFLDYSLLLSTADFRLSSVFGLEVKTIVIDPGHGGVDPGAVGGRGTKEKDIALDVALRLKERLSKAGHFEILMTRDADTTLSIAKRVEFANQGKTDLFISIHVNSLPNHRINFVETYYFGPPEDAETVHLAEQENKGSDFPIGDFNAMIQKIGDTLKRQESAKLAYSIQNSLFNNIKKYDKDVLDVGVKIAPFVVLLGVNAPSVLAEISCITSRAEEAKLNSPEYRDEIASFLEEGIVTYLTQRHVQLRGDDRHEREFGG